MVKADDKFEYEDEEGKEKTADFSNFDLLKNKLDLLVSLVNEHSRIMRDHDLYRKRKVPIITDRDIYSDMFIEEKEIEEARQRRA